MPLKPVNKGLFFANIFFHFSILVTFSVSNVDCDSLTKIHFDISIKNCQRKQVLEQTLSLK